MGLTLWLSRAEVLDATDSQWKPQFRQGNVDYTRMLSADAHVQTFVMGMSDRDGNG